ncbi:hypothetical protein F5890DRAFT_1063434 [Lentinula detonsa]|uniref:Uncharacterized protein n=1 Tax=Lentinula detonsa TaxID=2804962 RepID=A0AA38Q3F1_9AGAR|nr:hypothetical protein F5890DRAFT_1063434 [Lentinula detonsa]
MSPKSGSGSGGSKGVDANVLGFRVPVGKPPQQRLIIKHLREEAQMGLSVVPDSSRPQIKYLNSTISTIPEDPSLASSKALNSGHPHEPTRPSSTLNSVPTVTPNRPSYRHDTQHPSILVHKHSKVAAFSISRQHRANSKESKESSSGRFHVIMLAPRDVQEAFTNTATTKKLGTVIDRHEAARAAFSPGDQTVKEKDGKKVKSDGQIELDYRGTKSKELGQNAMKPPTPTKDTVSARDQVGTQSAPVYGRPYERTTAKTESERDDDLGNGKDRVATLPFERTGDGGQIMRIRTQNESQARENHKRAYGTLDYPPHSFTAPTAPSRPARILKRFLPWDLSLPSTSTSGHGTNSKATSSIGSATTTTQSVSTRDATPTQSTGSDISIPYDPPWVTFISREQQEIQRNVFGQLEYSFEHVGLLPAKAKDKDRERPKNSSSTKRDRLHEASILPKVHKKSDVLSIVPADAFFMLLPLWPAETDVHSQRLSPFDIPLIPVESRKYLLVFYKPLQMEKPSKDSTIYDSRLKILLAGFRAIARQVSYQDLQGTGVRLPEQGISVSGPLEDAFTQIPGLSDTTSETGAATSTTVPISTSASTSQLSVIASSYSRDAGLEFDPEALIELDLCRVLNSKENANATGNEPLSEGIHEEQIDTEQSMMVRLTPIGNAVMEMVWVGGLALSSFGS